MMKAVWDDPDNEVVILACADWLVETFDWSLNDAISHARYHAERSRRFRRGE